MDKQTAAFSSFVVIVGVGGGITVLSFVPGTIGYQLKDVEGRVVLSGRQNPRPVGWELWDDLVFAYHRKQKENWKGRPSRKDYQVPEETKKFLSEKCSSVLNMEFLGFESLDYQFAKEWCSVSETIGEKIVWNEDDFKDEDWKKIATLFHHLPDADYWYSELNLVGRGGDLNDESETKAKNFCRNKRKHYYVPGSKTAEVYEAVCSPVKTVKDIIGSDKQALDTEGNGDDSIWRQRHSAYSAGLSPKQYPLGSFDAIVTFEVGDFTVDNMKKVCRSSLKEEILQGTRRFLVEETKKWCFK